MDSYIFIIGVAVYLIGFFSISRTALSVFFALSGRHKLVVLSWVVMFAGQGQIFSRENTHGYISTLKSGEIYQLVWMLIGSFLIFLCLFRNRYHPKCSRVPVLALLLYSAVGMVSALVSPAPALTIYKAGQIFLDVILLVVAISASIESGQCRLFYNLSYILLSLILMCAALSAIFVPDIAFQNIEGAFAGVLSSVYPQVHANELGLLSAISLIISVNRLFSRNIRHKLFYFSVTILASIVLFYAQARTSIASFSLAFIVMTFAIPRMRFFSVSIVLTLFIFFGYRIINTEFDINISETEVGTYLRRGASDKQIESLSGRIGLWHAGWEMFKDSPLIGHGMDAGVRSGGLRYGLVDGTNMHNSHFQVLVNTGVLGYFFWLLFIITATSAVVAIPKQSFLAISGFRLEMLLVLFVILFRTFMGHVLVTHAFSMIFFYSTVVCPVAYNPASVNLKA